MSRMTVLTPAQLVDAALDRAIREQAHAVDITYSPAGSEVSLECDGRREPLFSFPQAQWEALRRLIGERSGLPRGEDPYQRALSFTHAHGGQVYFVAAIVGPTAVRLIPSPAPPSG